MWHSKEKPEEEACQVQLCFLKLLVCSIELLIFHDAYSGPPKQLCSGFTAEFCDRNTFLYVTLKIQRKVMGRLINERLCLAFHTLLGLDGAAFYM